MSDPWKDAEAVKARLREQGFIPEYPALKLFNQSGISRQRLLYGEWLSETEQERKLRELAETYHASCDAYDRRV